MKMRSIVDWTAQPKIKQILLLFSTPRTPSQVEKALGIKKLKMKPFLENNLVEILNPAARKGRLYRITNTARRQLDVSGFDKQGGRNYELMGWIISSPKQRMVILKVLDGIQRTSENIRERASKHNPHLSRISTKGILKELIKKGLVKSKMIEKKRYYWITEKGRVVREMM
jgi:predicted transcriptional regulator